MATLKPETLATFTVGGYVREHMIESQRSQNCYSLFQNVPSLVTSMIIKYYFVNGHFEILYKHVKISEDRLIIEQDVNGGWNHSIPILSTLKKICKWDLKIHKAQRHDRGSYLMIGISQCAVTDAKDTIFGARYIYAGWNGNKANAGRNGKNSYGQPYAENDIVSVELDLIKRAITFYKNGKSQGVAYENIEQNDGIEYRLAVSLVTKAKIEIINYVELY